MDHPYYMKSNPMKYLNIWASTALAGTSPRQIDLCKSFDWEFGRPIISSKALKNWI
jgi:hypothetical protein